MLPKMNDYLETLISQAIKEDCPNGDVTSETTIKPNSISTGKAIAKGSYIVSGIEIAKAVYYYVDENIKFKPFVKDGEAVKKGQILFSVKGRTQSILLAERTALNLMGHMTGIATKTNTFVKMVKGTRATILDTRKTLPGLRAIEKLAVIHGGGKNHRFSLSDAVLLKENHVAAAGGIKQALLSFKKMKGKIKIEIEVRNINELKEVLLSKVVPDVVMLDNMSPKDTKKAVLLTKRKFKLESSGGITEKNIKEYAKAGVDYISLGAITHSVSNADISFLLDTAKGD
jgi:nicotinate-nucleotide pyrophosphorylase (carboxylating)